MRTRLQAVAIAVLVVGCSLERVTVSAGDFDATMPLDAPVSDVVVPLPDALTDSRVPGDAPMPITALVRGSGRFARASIATFGHEDGSLTAVGADVPRERLFAGTPLRLIEGAATNLVLHSESQTAGWTASPATVAENAFMAPDGTPSADRVSAAAYGPYQQVSAPAGPLTLSFWVRAPVSAPAEFRARYSFDLSGFGEGVRVAGEAGETWARVMGVASPHSAQTEYVALDGRRGIPEPGDPRLAQDVVVWGWQLEAREFASSYVPSGVTRGTRVADAWEFDEADLATEFATAAGTVRVVPEWRHDARNGDAWAFSRGNTGIRIRPGGMFEVVVDDAAFVSVGPLPFDAGEEIQVSYDPDAGRLAVQFGMAAPVTAIGASWRWAAGPLRIGAAPGGGGEIHGWVSAPTRSP